MGLSAAAFKVATLTEPHERTDECYENHVRAFMLGPEFHRSLRGLEAGRCYEVGEREVTVHNSYSGHGLFREELARVFLGVTPRSIWDNPDIYADRPFFELIQFADNEGTIGPEAAADLAADFAEGREQWEADTRVRLWLKETYAEWAAAFEAAAGGGLVMFR